MSDSSEDSGHDEPGLHQRPNTTPQLFRDVRIHLSQLSVQSTDYEKYTELKYTIDDHLNGIRLIDGIRLFLEAFPFIQPIDHRVYLSPYFLETVHGLLTESLNAYDMREIHRGIPPCRLHPPPPPPSSPPPPSPPPPPPGPPGPPPPPPPPAPHFPPPGPPGPPPRHPHRRHRPHHPSPPSPPPPPRIRRRRVYREFRYEDVELITMRGFYSDLFKSLFSYIVSLKDWLLGNARPEEDVPQPPPVQERDESDDDDDDYYYLDEFDDFEIDLDDDDTDFDY